MIRPLVAIEFLYLAILLVMAAYVLQHFVLTLNRLLSGVCEERKPTELPSVCIMIPAHNEELVLEATLDAILRLDYPSDRLLILVVDDHSTDSTGVIAQRFAAERPQVQCVHRRTGRRGKPAALNDALPLVTQELVIQFDADYLPPPQLVRQLTAPFSDPTVGLVMGRVTPYNIGANLVTRLLELERSGGYQVAQAARMNLGLLPQYGGTAGGIRRSMLLEMGGWCEDSLTEDTDLTFRGVLRGWRTIYLNHAACFEQVPGNWADRESQIIRWARGHNGCLFRYGWQVLCTPNLSLFAKIDAWLLLTVFTSPLLLLLQGILGTILVCTERQWSALAALPVLAIAMFGTLGNFAPFFAIVTGVRSDAHYRRLRLLPLNILGFLTSAQGCIKAIFIDAWESVFHQPPTWVKTPRFGERNTEVASLQARGFGYSVAGILLALLTWRLGWGASMLLSASGLILCFPFLPALCEWRWPVDIEPVSMKTAPESQRSS